MQPLKVNFSTEEASAEARVILPTGNYVVNITEGELKEVKPGRKNTGKPYWSLQFVVQEGQYAGARLFGSIMLFDGALYSLSQLLKALGYQVGTGDFEIPTLDEIMGKTIVIYGQKKPAETKDGTELNERFEVKSYKPHTANGKPSAGSHLLP